MVRFFKTHVQDNRGINDGTTRYVLTKYYKDNRNDYTIFHDKHEALSAFQINSKFPEIEKIELREYLPNDGIVLDKGELIAFSKKDEKNGKKTS